MNMYIVWERTDCMMELRILLNNGVPSHILDEIAWKNSSLFSANHYLLLLLPSFPLHPHPLRSPTKFLNLMDPFVKCRWWWMETTEAVVVLPQNLATVWMNMAFTAFALIRTTLSGLNCRRETSRLYMFIRSALFCLTKKSASFVSFVRRNISPFSLFYFLCIKNLSLLVLVA